MLVNLYTAIDKCQIAMSVLNRASTQSPAVMDIIQVTANGRRLTTPMSLLGYQDPIALTPDATSVEVSISLNNEALRDAALTKFQPNAVIYGGLEDYDTNQNGVLDGIEAYSAYEFALSREGCGVGQDNPDSETNWMADQMFGDTVVQSWQDSPPLRFQLLATGTSAAPVDNAPSFGSADLPFW